ncbi:MAG: hypothetical protein KGI73_01870 [Patescibacteria group bacterium]|nr:hypothetical protein [Patescibacteria group bacterium]
MSEKGERRIPGGLGEVDTPTEAEQEDAGAIVPGAEPHVLVSPSRREIVIPIERK